MKNLYLSLILTIFSLWQGVAMAEFKLVSHSIKHGENIDPKYTCDGDNISPHLKWSDVPQGTKELVLIVDDPDAAKVKGGSGRTYVHWIVDDIDANEIPEDASRSGTVPGKEVKNHSRKTQYYGPCPPDKEHTYRFNLFALNEDIDVPAQINADDFQKKYKEKILGKAQLKAKYNRS